jgi:hypothetical protein
MTEHLEHHRMSNEERVRVEQHVRSRLIGQVGDFELVVRGEGLVLRGRARSYYAKQLAQHAVMVVTSLPIWANEIEVS